MAYLFFFLILYSILLRRNFAASALEKPTDVTIHVDELALTANVSWKGPFHSVRNTYVELGDNHGRRMSHTYVKKSSSSYMFTKVLHSCKEYAVRLLFQYENEKYSDRVNHKFVMSALDVPSDVKIQVNESALTANVSWKTPTTKYVKKTLVELRDFKNNQLYWKHYENQSSHSLIPAGHLQRCREYVTELRFCYSDAQCSSIAQRGVVISDEDYTTSMNSSMNISWKTYLNNSFSVKSPSENPLYEIFPSGTITKHYSNISKYILDTSAINVINFELRHANQSDAGLYRVVEKFSGADESCAFLTVSDKPKLPQLSVHPRQVFVGDEITFTCKSTAQRWPEYVPTSLSYTYHGINGTSEGQNLMVKNVSRSHKRLNVSCIATDDLNFTSDSSNVFTIDLYYGPDEVSITPHIQTLNRTEGDTIGPISCTADCNPPCDIEWRTKSTGKFTSFLSKSILSIQNIKRNQSGIFRCKASSKPNSRTKRKDIAINVQYPSTINEVILNETKYSEACNFSFLESMNLDISLEIDSNPDSFVYFYKTKTSKRFTNNTKSGNIYTFRRNGLRCEDSGQYTIEASNGIKNSSIRIVHLDIHCKPRNISFESKLIGTMKEAVENVTVTLVANPRPVIEWMALGRTNHHDWKVSDVGNSEYRGFSQITVYDEHSFGVYGVKICNHQKLDCTEMNLTIQAEGKPDPPQNLSVKEISHNWASLYFVAGFDGGLEQTFNIQCRPIDTTIANMIMETVVTNDTRKDADVHHIIKGLIPNTQYDVTLIATNSLGNSSTFLEFCTNIEPVSDHEGVLTMQAILLGGGIGIPVAIVILLLVLILMYKKRKHEKENTSTDKVPIKDLNSSNENEGAGAEYACVSKVPKNSRKYTSEVADEYACVPNKTKNSKKKKETRIEENNEYAEVERSNGSKGPSKEDDKVELLYSTPDRVKVPETSKTPIRTPNDDGLLYIELEFTSKESCKNRRPIIHGADSKTDYVDIDFTKRVDPLPESDDDATT